MLNNTHLRSPITSPDAYERGAIPLRRFGRTERAYRGTYNAIPSAVRGPYPRQFPVLSLVLTPIAPPE